jgi:hypothetical protein
MPQPPYVTLASGPVDCVPVGGSVLGSVPLGRAGGCSDPRTHAHLRYLTCPSVPVASLWCSKGSPGPRGLPFGPGHQGPYPAGYTRRRVEIPAARFPLAFRPTGLRFLDHPVPAGDLGLPCGRLTETTGPRQGFHVPHSEDAAGVGAPSTPWPAVSHYRCCLHRKPPVPSSTGPCPAENRPSAGVTYNEALTRGSRMFARPAFPLPVAPRWPRRPWA